MTAEGAKNIINSLEEFKDEYGTSYEYAYPDESDFIVEAIRKQIPKKPYRHESSPSDIYLCCTCGSTFIVRDRIHMNYCNNCGQHISWEEGE